MPSSSTLNDLRLTDNSLLNRITLDETTSNPYPSLTVMVIERSPVLSSLNFDKVTPGFAKIDHLLQLSDLPNLLTCKMGSGATRPATIRLTTTAFPLVSPSQRFWERVQEITLSETRNAGGKSTSLVRLVCLLSAAVAGLVRSHIKSHPNRWYLLHAAAEPLEDQHDGQCWS